MNTISEQVHEFEGQIVHFKSYHRAYLTIQRSIQVTQMRGVPSGVVLIGEPGSGKSTLCQQLLAALPPVSEAEDETGIHIKRPAILCGLPTRATIKSFAKTLLNSLECQILSGDAYDLTERVITQFKTQQVEVAYLDEFQMLADKKSEQARMDVSNCVARLFDRTGAAFVVSGTPVIESLFYSVELLTRRFPFFATLPRLNLDLSNRESDLQIVLHSLDRKMYEIGHFSKGVHLQDLNVALGLYAASTGNLEMLRLLLSNAFLNALNRNKKTLTLNDLADAFEITRHDHCLLDEGNPFEMPYSKLLKKVQKKNDDEASILRPVPA